MAELQLTFRDTQGHYTQNTTQYCAVLTQTQDVGARKKKHLARVLGLGTDALGLLLSLFAESSRDDHLQGGVTADTSPYTITRALWAHIEKAR